MRSLITYLAGVILALIWAGGGVAQSDGRAHVITEKVFTETDCTDWSYILSVVDIGQDDAQEATNLDVIGATLDWCGFNPEQRLEITQALVRSSRASTGYLAHKFRLNRLALFYGDTREAALQYYFEIVRADAEELVAAHLAGELDTLAAYYIEDGVRTGVGHDRGLCDFIRTYEMMAATSVELPPFLSCVPFGDIDYRWFLENAD